MNTLLLRLFVHRIWLRTLLWSAAIALFIIVGIVAYQQAFPDPAQRDITIAALAHQPGLQTLLGTPGDIGTTGGFIVWRMGMFVYVLSALYAILSIAMLTRGQEENGLYEHLWSGAIHRTAPLSAAIISTGTGSILLGTITTLVLLGEGTPTRGAILFGAACAAISLIYLAAATVIAQLITTRRGVSGLAGALLALGFVLRAIADTHTDLAWLSWLSPLGWAQHIDAYTTNQAWPLTLFLGATTLLFATAIILESRRDLHTGLWHQRPGPATSTLRTIEMLTLRLHLTTIISWALGLGLLAGMMGALVNGVSAVLDGNPQLTALLASFSGEQQHFTEAYLGTIFQLIGLLIAIIAAQAVTTARREEQTSRAEILVVQPLSRTRWLGSYLFTAVISATSAAVVSGIAGSIAWAATGGENTWILLGAALNTLPVAMIFASVATLAVAMTPTIAIPLGMALPAIAFLLAFLGPLIDVPSALMNLSPFHHQAHMPAEPFTSGPAFVLLAIAATLSAIGLICIRYRDLRLA